MVEEVAAIEATLVWGPSPTTDYFLGSTNSKEFDYSAGDLGLIPGLGTSPGEGNGYPLQYSCLENSMDRGAGGLQSMGLQSVRHNWENFTYFYSAWQDKMLESLFLFIWQFSPFTFESMGSGLKFIFALFIVCEFAVL